VAHSFSDIYPYLTRFSTSRFARLNMHSPSKALALSVRIPSSIHCALRACWGQLPLPGIGICILQSEFCILHSACQLKCRTVLYATRFSWGKCLGSGAVATAPQWLTNATECECEQNAQCR